MLIKSTHSGVHDLYVHAHGSSLLPASSDTDNCRWQLPSGLLIDVTRWQSPCSNSLVENFLLHRKRDPFFRRIWISPQTAKLQENLESSRSPRARL